MSDRMDPMNFCYWLQGYAEITNSQEVPTPEQWKIIKDHLQLVFDKVTPDYTNTKMDSLKDVLEEIENDKWVKEDVYPFEQSPTVIC